MALEHIFGDLEVEACSPRPTNLRFAHPKAEGLFGRKSSGVEPELRHGEAEAEHRPARH